MHRIIANRPKSLQVSIGNTEPDVSHSQVTNEPRDRDVVATLFVTAARGFATWVLGLACKLSSQGKGPPGAPPSRNFQERHSCYSSEKSRSAPLDNYVDKPASELSSAQQGKDDPACYLALSSCNLILSRCEANFKICSLKYHQGDGGQAGGGRGGIILTIYVYHLGYFQTCLGHVMAHERASLLCELGSKTLKAGCR